MANTSGAFNTFVGVATGLDNTTGGSNVFIGHISGSNNSTGHDNIFVGDRSGLGNTTGSYNIEIGNQGTATDQNTIRIGDPATQKAAYFAGIFGQPTVSGSPVFVDSTGKLGTTGGATGLVTSFNMRTGAVVPAQGDYSFSMLSGGSNSNQVTLSNSSNSFTGKFSGDGSGLINLTFPSGSNNYIQNNNSKTPQSKANFNIDGTGTANIFNVSDVNGASGNYQIGGNHVLEFQRTIGGGNGLNIGAGADRIYLSKVYDQGTSDYPDLVCVDSTGLLGTYYGAFSCGGLLFDAYMAKHPMIKAQQQQIEQMQQRLSQLEAVVAQLTQAAAQK